MTNLRKLFLATALAASLPALAASPMPVVIGFEKTATPYDSNLGLGGDGQPVGSNYSAYGVTFDSNAYSFYSSLNSKFYYGMNVDNLPSLLPDPVANQALLDRLSEQAKLDVFSPALDTNGNPAPPTNQVVMAPYHESPSCIDSNEGCESTRPSISTVIHIDATHHYDKVDFRYSANGGNILGQVSYGLISSTGATQRVSGGYLADNTVFGDRCDPTSSMWWCQWNSVSYTAPTGWTLQSIEFTGKEGAMFYDNIILTPPTPTPEPSTYALTLLGLVGIRFLAVRRRRSN